MAGVVVVTGGGRGIGAATCRIAARQGWTVAVNYRVNRGSAEAVRRDVLDAGGQAELFQADISSESAVESLFAAVDERLGTPTGLVSCAGILDTQMRVEEMTADRIRRIFDTNVVGSILCAREAVRRMSTRRGGRGGAIVNISSGAARSGSPGEYVDYAASKGAIDTFTIGLAKEVAADGVRVNAVRPGFIDTEIHSSGGEPDRIERVKEQVAMRRAGRPEEVAAAIVWLLSDAASYTTGAILDVNGGL